MPTFHLLSKFVRYTPTSQTVSAESATLEAIKEPSSLKKASSLEPEPPAKQAVTPQRKPSYDASISLKEYQKKLYERVLQIPLHPSKAQSSVNIFVSDGALDRMKKEPGYEYLILALLKRNLGSSSPSETAPKHTSYLIGQHLDSYLTISSGPSKKIVKILEERKARSSFWERRDRTRQELERLDKKKMEQELTESHVLYNKSVQLARAETAIGVKSVRLHEINEYRRVADEARHNILKSSDWISV